MFNLILMLQKKCFRSTIEYDRYIVGHSDINVIKQVYIKISKWWTRDSILSLSPDAANLFYDRGERINYLQDLENYLQTA